jgi:putative peptide zinc metalloprotease protein
MDPSSVNRMEPPLKSTVARISPLRPDIEVSFVPRSGSYIAVVKDPVAHRFFEMDPADWEIAQQLKAEFSVREQIESLRAALPDLCSDVSDKILATRILRVSAELRATGLAEGLAHEHSASEEAHSVKSLMASAGAKLSKLLFLRFRLLNPRRLLDAGIGLAPIFFNVWFLWLTLILFATSFLGFVMEGGLKMFDPSWFSSISALVALYFGIAALKFLHEAAHAFAVRFFGGDVHEISLTLVAGMPVFHVEASDSYMFEKKFHRLAVSAAGILVELFASAILIGVWFFVAEGFFKQLLTNLILIASVSTLFFNGNPLMRYDGYYILSDAIDMPDLRQRSRRFVLSLLEGLLSGRPIRPGGSSGQSLLLGFYGLASSIYMVVVFFSIWKFLSTALAPYGLKWVGDILIAAWGLTGLVIPTISAFREVLKKVIQQGSRSRRRAFFILIGFLILVALLFIIPLPYEIRHECVLQPAGSSMIRAMEEGFVQEISVREGDAVYAGQKLARLENRSIALEFATATALEQKAQTFLRAAMAEGKTAELAALQNDLQVAQSRLAEAARKLENLILKSDIDGHVASRKLEAFQGRLLQRGATFCVIKPDEMAEFQIPLDEREAHRVQKGQSVHLRLYAIPELKLHGQVETAPLRLQPDKTKPLITQTHFVAVKIEAPVSGLKIGMSGRAKIECGRRPYAFMLWDDLLGFLKLDLRMR